jgi:hypothetical protein
VDSFPRLSIKGKVFRIKMNGQETPLIDQSTRKPLAELDVVLVNASPLLSKSYYQKGYEDGDVNQPDCWSLDSIKPDPTVINKQNDVCPTCQWNAFGSAPSRDPKSGKRGGKACQDSRRVALVMPTQLGNTTGQEPIVFMLKVPQSSLKNLKAYAELLDRRGWDQAACVTKLSFEWNEAYPKLTFEFVDGLSDHEYTEVAELAESQKVKDMLLAPDFDNVVGPEQVATNKVMEPRQRQAAPVFGDEAQAAEDVGEVVTPAPAEKPAAKPQAVQSEIIELPDGQLFDKSTGEFVERPAAKVEMPQRDPDIVELPDGQFFNQKLKVFVTGPEVGAKPKVSTELPKRRGRPKKAKGAPVEEAQVEEQSAATAEVPQESEAVDNVEQVEQEEPSPSKETAPATASMEALLKAVLPAKK